LVPELTQAQRRTQFWHLRTLAAGREQGLLKTALGLVESGSGSSSNSSPSRESEKVFLNVSTFHQPGATSILDRAHGYGCLLLPLLQEREKRRWENQLLEARPEADFPTQGGIRTTTPRTRPIDSGAAWHIAVYQVRQVNVAS